MNNLTVWKATPSVLRKKMFCILNLRKRNRYVGHRFCLDNGDIPLCVITHDSNRISVVNNRGLAYATRNRLRYRKQPNKFKGFREDM